MSGTPPRSPSPTRVGDFHAGRFVLGALVALLGVAWLLEATGTWHVPWKTVLPVTLIVLGIALVLSARSGKGQGGLIVLGVLLTLVLTVGTVVDVPFEGGVGDRTEHPRTLSELRGEYQLAVGKLILDLTEIPVEPHALAPRTVAAHVGIGQLMVVVPRSVVPEVRSRVGLGSTQVFGRERSGVDVRNDSFATRVPAPAVAAPYTLDLSVGIGDIEVAYG